MRIKITNYINLSSINLSILDFKYRHNLSIFDIAETINLSILDFKFSGVIVGCFVLSLYKSIHIGF